MESIYEYINKSIKVNGMLKDDFNLDKYTDCQPNKMKFALGALDGISYFHSKNEVDEEQLEFLKKILRKKFAYFWQDVYNNIVFCRGRPVYGRNLCKN